MRAMLGRPQVRKILATFQATLVSGPVNPWLKPWACASGIVLNI